VTIERVDGLRSALAVAPENHVLRLLLAEALVEGGKPGEALVEYELLLAAEQLDDNGFIAAGRAALAAGRHHCAPAFVDAAGAAVAVSGIWS
jgi:transitional endoplasmic reticulum ATPase